MHCQCSRTASATYNFAVGTRSMLELMLSIGPPSLSTVGSRVFPVTTVH